MQNFLCSYTYKYMRHFSVWSCYGVFFCLFILFYSIFFPWICVVHTLKVEKVLPMVWADFIFHFSVLESLETAVWNSWPSAVLLLPWLLLSLCQPAEPPGRKGLASSLCWKSLQLIQSSPLITSVRSLVAQSHGTPARCPDTLGMECAGSVAAAHSRSSSTGWLENSECALSLGNGSGDEKDDDLVLGTEPQHLGMIFLES